ncbi:MAG: 30S ribosomal protein S13, partial [Nitriliruptoraceae bacterium]
GVDIPREKRVVVALTYIYGVGRTRAEKTLAATDIDPDTRVRELTDEQIQRLRVHIENEYRVEGDLRRETANNIKRKIEIGSYQGVRHRLSLPVRGQRTHTNARGRKGPKRAVGGIRKPTRKG